MVDIVALKCSFKVLDVFVDVQDMVDMIYVNDKVSRKYQVPFVRVG